jgi:hypothetical protein
MFLNLTKYIQKKYIVNNGDFYIFRTLLFYLKTIFKFCKLMQVKQANGRQLHVHCQLLYYNIVTFSQCNRRCTAPNLIPIAIAYV